MAKLESAFQREVRDELERAFPGCMVLKNDSGYITGIPDLTVLYNGRWAFLEIKRSANEKFQPNQIYYIDWAKTQGGHGAVVYPEILYGVLSDLDRHFNKPKFTKE